VRCDQSNPTKDFQLVAVAVEEKRTVSRRLPLSRLPQRDSTHACPHPECGREVPSMMWACLAHWQALPPRVRQGIWAAGRSVGPGSLQLQEAEERAFAYWGTIERELRELAAATGTVAGTAGPPRATA
jgi:hypothetical protein